MALQDDGGLQLWSRRGGKRQEYHEGGRSAHARKLYVGGTSNLSLRARALVIRGLHGLHGTVSEASGGAA